MPVLSPFVYWAQNEKSLFLKVDLKDVKDPTFNFETRKLQFKCEGLGAQGSHEYAFCIDFNEEIEANKSNYKVTDNRVDITLTKSSSGWWPRLTSQPQKPGWLKIDFDKWQSEEDMNDEEVRDVRQDYPSLYEKLKNEEFGYKMEDWKKVYLTIYNLVMFVGFLYVMVVIAIRYWRDDIASIPGTYAAVGQAFCFLQLLQFLEVMHPLFGYVRGNPLMSIMQVGGRAVVLFLLIEAEPRMQTKPVVFYLFVTWAAVEVIRYPFYMIQMHKMKNSLLTWLRYNAWIILYPLGFICEAMIVFRSIIYADESNKWSITMPNSLNFTFHFPTFLRIYLMLFMFPGIMMLMNHMYKMKTKKLPGKKIKKF